MRVAFLAIVVAVALVGACGGEPPPLLGIYPARLADGPPGAPAGWEAVSFRETQYEVGEAPIATIDNVVDARRSQLQAGAVELDFDPSGVAALQDYTSNGEQLVAFKFRGRLAGFAATASLVPSGHVYVKDLLQYEVQALVGFFDQQNG